MRSGLSRATLVLALGLGACVPMREVYYRPSAVSGSLIKNVCAGLVAPADVMRFDIGAVQWRLSDGNGSLSIGLWIPKGSVARFASDEVELLVEGRRQRYHLGAFSHDAPGERRLQQTPALDPLVGGDVALLLGAAPRTFGQFVDLDRGQAESYELRLPTVVVDGNRFDPPPITFTREIGFALRPVNC